MLKQQRMFRVYHSTGNGTRRGPSFRRLDDAKRYVLAQRTPGSYAIRRPNGKWYRWSNSKGYILPARPEQREKDEPRSGRPPGVPIVEFNR